MTFSVVFSGLSIKIKRESKDKFTIYLPFLLQSYIEKIKIGNELTLDMKSIIAGLSNFK